MTRFLRCEKKLRGVALLQGVAGGSCAMRGHKQKGKASKCGLVVVWLF